MLHRVHRRRTIRLVGHDYSLPGYYFLTICTAGRIPLLARIQNDEIRENSCGDVVRSVWQTLSEKYRIYLDEFVIMPDHIHGIINIGVDVGAIHELPLRDDACESYRLQRRAMLIPRLVGYLKMNTAKRINEILGRTHGPVWQRNYFERVIRDEHELSRIRTYILENPKNWSVDFNNPHPMY